MTVFAFSRTRSSLECLAALNEAAPADWSRHAIQTRGGSLAWAGDNVQVGRRWVVLGLPSKDPWGWPGSDLDPQELERRLESWGSAATASATGPFMVFDRERMSAHQPGNGLIPLFTSIDGEERFGSTAQVVANQLARPGERVIREFPRCAALERDRRTMLKGARVRGEMLEHRPMESPPASAEALVPSVRDPFWGGGVEAINRVRDLAETIAPRMWWESRLRGRWLFAPCLERPTIDRLTEMAP